MPRKRINSVITEASQLFESFLNSIKNEVHSRLQTLGANDESLYKINEVFEKFAEPFQGMKSEKQRLSHFRSCGTFIEPQSYKIGERTEFKSGPMGTRRKEVSVVAQFIPVREVLKQFFELPGIFDKTMKYINRVKSCNHIISNIVQSPFWTQKCARYGDKIILPLLMYFDDYENNNALGSHKGISKCGAVYLSVPCLPSEYVSKIENIFLFILFNTLDRNTFKNSIVFEKVITELKFLQNEGINIHIPTGEIKIHFDLALIVGDNLGLHSILGFVESFRANKFCRFCLIDYSKISGTSF